MSEEKTVTRNVLVKVRFEGIKPTDEQQKIAEGFIYGNINENLECRKTISLDEVHVINEIHRTKLFPLLKLDIRKDIEMGNNEDTYCTIWYTIVCEDDTKGAIRRVIQGAREDICKKFNEEFIKTKGDALAKEFCEEVTNRLIKNFKFDSKVFTVNTKFHPEDMSMTVDLETDDPILGPLFKWVNEMNNPQS